MNLNSLIVIVIIVAIHMVFKILGLAFASKDNGFSTRNEENSKLI